MQGNSDKKLSYDDIIELPHHVSNVHPQMSRHDRAAQFSPFAALTGYDAAVMEAARLTEERLELDETSMSLLNAKIQILQKEGKRSPALSVTYFLPDDKKAGGEYVTVSGTLKRIDDFKRTLILMNGISIPIDDIVEIKSELFAMLEENYTMQ